MGLVSSRSFGAYAAGEAAILWHDRLYRPGAKRPVVFCHQHTGQAGDTTQPNAASYGLDVICGAGMPVVAADLGGPSTWGSDASLARVTDAANFAVTKLGAKADKVLLWGVSMGTLTALLWAKANPAKVAGVAAALPVVNLADMHDNRVYGGNNYGVIIEAAYGGLAAYQAALPTKNPQASAASYGGLPIKLWRSTDDPVAVPAEAAAFAAASGAELEDAGAAGHSLLALDFRRVASWLSARA